MSAPAPYIPRRDVDLNNWLQAFSQQVSAIYPALALVKSDAENIAKLAASFAAAYQPVTSPATKTAAAVAHKDTTRTIVLAQIRTYAQFIANCPGVSSAAKIGLKLNPRTSPPAPITPPNSFPSLALQHATPLSCVLRYRDNIEVSSKAKPYGVIQCQLFGQASDTPITDRSNLPLVATPTKSPFVVSFRGADVGRKFYMAARWATRTGLVGPWSPIINVTVVG